MLASDVLATPVVCDGQNCGVVVDVRCVLRGPVGSGLLATPEVVGLLIGRRAAMGFMGYERRSQRRPAVLNRFFARRQRNSFLVAIDDIENISDAGVILKQGFRRWSVAL